MVEIRIFIFCWNSPYMNFKSDLHRVCCRLFYKRFYLFWVSYYTCIYSGLLSGKKLCTRSERFPGQHIVMMEGGVAVSNSESRCRPILYTCTHLRILSLMTEPVQFCVFFHFAQMHMFLISLYIWFPYWERKWNRPVPPRVGTHKNHLLSKGCIVAFSPMMQRQRTNSSGKNNLLTERITFLCERDSHDILSALQRFLSV